MFSQGIRGFRVWGRGFWGCGLMFKGFGVLRLKVKGLRFGVKVRGLGFTA